jgi:membrane-bound lytic murein transglycosylase D
MRLPHTKSLSVFFLLSGLALSAGVGAEPACDYIPGHDECISPALTSSVSPALISSVSPASTLSGSPASTPSVDPWTHSVSPGWTPSDGAEGREARADHHPETTAEPKECALSSQGPDDGAGSPTEAHLNFDPWELGMRVQVPPMAARAEARPYDVEDRPEVQRYLDRYLARSQKVVVEKWLERSGRYLNMIQRILRETGIPEELIFTAMIESNFNPVAVSRAGAKGLWQFMAATAQRYGLRVDQWVDERLDPEKSTLAAAHYLRDLYATFGSWPLAQAAYNAGEGRVLQAIEAMRTRDFWELARGQILANETKDFVAAVHAVTLIGREPDRFGLSVTPDEPVLYEVVEVPPATRLGRLATLSGLPADTLITLNSALQLGETPPDTAHPIKVPPGWAASIRAALAGPVAVRAAESSRQVARRVAGRVHVVKPGETLGAIARLHGVSPSDIARINDLRSGSFLRAGARLRIVNTRP